ncbi:MAG: Eco57I restriction-modification methylase domain-containing protein [Ruminococcus flavefaciens]|nr:Eco57I restriction-modification methylase domain-containing protein [Ruminococcus flavefaciens]
MRLTESNRLQLQTAIDNSKSIEYRRRLGQFSTPYELAQEIISYGLTLQNEKEISFLEPAIGTGVFYSALLSECDKQFRKLKSATGIELDADFYSAAYELWGDTGIKLINGDFTETESFERIDFLVSNPPYVRHHYIRQEQKTKLASITRNETGLSFSKLAGLYCYFILCAHKWLAPNAICGWLIPSEFMDVNYGSILKEYLLNNVHLLRVHRYNPENCKFDDAMVSSCVVWFKNEMVAGNYSIEFSYGGTHEKSEVSRNIDKNTLEHHRKWTHFPEKENTNGRLYGSDTLTLGDFFTIKRGLATGDNDFFILSREQIDDLELDMQFFTPILPSPRHLKCDEVFSDKDGYPCLDMQYFLLSCNLPEDEVKEYYPSVWHYLNGGKDTTAQKYLCKNRKVWYFQENRSAAPFLCSYMGRGRSGHIAPFRFILNHTNAIATNSYLMLYPKAILQEAIIRTPDILYKVWDALSNITANDLESEGRVYGGGLKKIEPKELACVKCPCLAEMLVSL